MMPPCQAKPTKYKFIFQGQPGVHEQSNCVEKGREGEETWLRSPKATQLNTERSFSHASGAWTSRAEGVRSPSRLTGGHVAYVLTWYFLYERYFLFVFVSSNKNTSHIGSGSLL